MTLLDLVGYVADVAILLTYAVLATRAKPLPFHVANAVGAIPLLAIELQTGAYPVVPLTLTFGVLGLVGIFKETA